MKRKILEEINIPEGINCEITHEGLKVSMGGNSLLKEIDKPGIKIHVKDGKIIIECKGAHREDNAFIKSLAAHLSNIFDGLHKPFVYELEICNVHFPMTAKVEGSKLIISNFLGEKEKRTANVLENVKVDIKGQKITVSSSDKAAAGQTAANIEKATKITKRDRRVFQDGIFITSKPGESI